MDESDDIHDDEKKSDTKSSSKSSSKWASLEDDDRDKTSTKMEGERERSSQTSKSTSKSTSKWASLDDDFFKQSPPKDTQKKSEPDARKMVTSRLEESKRKLASIQSNVVQSMEDAEADAAWSEILERRKTSLRAGPLGQSEIGKQLLDSSLWQNFDKIKPRPFEFGEIWSQITNQVSDVLSQKSPTTKESFSSSSSKKSSSSLSLTPSSIRAKWWSER